MPANPQQPSPPPQERKATRILCLVLISLSTHSWINRENRVPHYQRLFQKNDGVRQWNKVRAGAFLVSLARCKMSIGA